LFEQLNRIEDKLDKLLESLQPSSDKE
jgi:hypothetical protein